ncbi:MAG: hypothetical protein K0U29_08370 [Gammaproteobacteria bacterium]|nr:hypothetical protein [Gammaproteobacteria bacterium]MCH9744926.1 hypothetical protein [Gammaproteobacteria bacterium]
MRALLRNLTHEHVGTGITTAIFLAGSAAALQSSESAKSDANPIFPQLKVANAESNKKPETESSTSSHGHNGNIVVDSFILFALLRSAKRDSVEFSREVFPGLTDKASETAKTKFDATTFGGLIRKFVITNPRTAATSGLFVSGVALYAHTKHALEETKHMAERITNDVDTDKLNEKQQDPINPSNTYSPFS